MPSIAFQPDPSIIWDLFPTLSGSLAFDVGANGGSLAGILANKFKRVVAFEPCAESFAVLAGAHPSNVVPVPMAVSDREGTLTLNLAVNAIGMGELVTGDTMADWGELVGTREVEATTLDDAVTLYGRPDFIKIDTEGHEVQVVRGGLDTFATMPRTIIEVHGRLNGEMVRDLLPRYVFTEIRHPYYVGGSREWWDHYWLVSV